VKFKVVVRDSEDWHLTTEVEAASKLEAAEVALLEAPGLDNGGPRFTEVVSVTPMEDSE